MACFFSAALLALAWIDAKTFLLPDAITQALLWVGLVGSGMSLTPTPLIQAVSGAVLGYSILWLVSWGFQTWGRQRRHGPRRSQAIGCIGRVGWNLELAAGAAVGFWFLD